MVAEVGEGEEVEVSLVAMVTCIKILTQSFRKLYYYNQMNKVILEYQ